MQSVEITQGKMTGTLVFEGYSRLYETEPIYRDPESMGNAIGTNVLVNDFEFLLRAKTVFIVNLFEPVTIEGCEGEYEIAAIVKDDGGQIFHLLQHGPVGPIWFDKEKKS